MAIISFALTTKEFLSGRKTVTRRDWSDHHLAMWQAQWDVGRLEHDAWNKSPRSVGGRRIGRFRLMVRPYRERLADMPEGDLFAEGGMCATIDDFCELIGKSPDDVMTVVRFQKLKGGE